MIELIKHYTISLLSVFTSQCLIYNIYHFIIIKENIYRWQITLKIELPWDFTNHDNLMIEYLCLRATIPANLYLVTQCLMANIVDS